MVIAKRYASLLVKSLMPVLAVICQLSSSAKEGMWIPATIKAHEADMRSMGLEIPIDKIYNENGTGLNNAVVLFGKGCTGEVISSKGLVLTNHHCGYGSAQGLSSPDKDYFANGFWAGNRNEELPCKGLTITFIRRMENVTAQVLQGVTDLMPDAARDTLIAHNIAATETEFKKKTGMDALIKPYFKGNQYWVAIAETYRDIRLVGFPPNAIGAFGGDVENWIWPRHTGDFSIFRVYAGKDNKPADYNAANQPYNTEQFFNINISGYKEGNFTMVYGFPGTTDEYISSYELKQVYSITDPISIDARTRKLDVWTKHMSASRDNFIKYTAKRAQVANGWKKWQGEVLGLKANDATGKKEVYEKSFQQWADADNTLPFADSLLAQLRTAALPVDKLIELDQYNKEAALGIELVQQGSAATQLLNCFRSNLSGQALTDTLKKAVAAMEGFYKNYDAATDKDVFVALMALYIDKCSGSLPVYYKSQYGTHSQDIAKWAEDVYANSLFTSQEKLGAFAAKAVSADSISLLSDPAWQLYDGIATLRTQKIQPVLKDYYARMRYLNRLYLKARMEKDKDNTFYPDANLTQRITYGQVHGLDPEGPAKYSFQTTLGDAMALEDSTTENFKVPAKLKALYKAKNYGRWGVRGTMPLAFIASNHTSGGNSGSPVINGKGELIGTNFDRAYEGTMSDYYFDPTRCRNISVDIRYTLFIIDKFGGAGWLIDEMNIVKK